MTLRHRFLFIFTLLASLLGFAQASPAQTPLRLEITQGVIETLPFAMPTFITKEQRNDTTHTLTPKDSDSNAAILRFNMQQVITNDLINTGLLRLVPREAYIGQPTDLSLAPTFANWKAINAQALIIAELDVQGDSMTFRFRLYDVFSGAELGEGIQFGTKIDNWRRIAHKSADIIYARLTGESGYFDSRLAFIAEDGKKNARTKRLAIMDYDGANLTYLTNDNAIVLSPRFSPNGREIVYTSYETGRPQIFLVDITTGEKRLLDNDAGMSFSPRFSPDGLQVLLSLSTNGNADIYLLDLISGQKQQITNTAAIETSPSFSPDGTQIVFESDRGGQQQIYVMPAFGGAAKRISFGTGRYGTPVWSPRGDSIAFTKISGGQFHIGVMRTDGTKERLLTRGFLDESPTWSPNGRVIMFTRQFAGSEGAVYLYSVDITGRNVKRVPTPAFATDASWSGLRP